MISVARNLNGISLNGEAEYLTDDNLQELHFANRQEAVTYLESLGLTREDMEFFFAPEVGVEYARTLDMPSLIQEGE